MVRLLSIISLILAIVLFPPAALALISNNAVPGDVTYPIKRVLEDGIFAVASIHPTSKAWFAAARSDRRFKEFTTLVAQGKKTSDTLNELVEQTQIAANQIANVSDEGQKQKLVQQLAQSIEKYDQGLQQVSSPTTPLPQATPVPQESASPTATVLPSPTPTPPPVVQPTPVPTAVPTATPHPTPAPTLSPDDEDRQRQIDEARRRLEEIRRRLEEQQRQRSQDVESHSNSVQEVRQESNRESSNKKEDKQDRKEDKGETKQEKGDSNLTPKGGNDGKGKNRSQE